MDFIFLGLIGLALVFGTPIMAIVALVRSGDLKRRLAEAEGRLLQQSQDIEFLRQRLADGPAPEEPRVVSPWTRPSASPPAPAADQASAGPPAAPASEEPPPASPEPVLAATATGPRVPAAAEPVAPEPPATRPETLEEKIGARWAVWVGAVALGLGALFLVRYTIEQGWLGPGVRLALGALFSAALLAVGEALRRRDVDLPKLPFADVPAGLTAAGAVGLFGVVYAAHALYDFIGPATAFVLLGLVGVGTMALAGVHGPALAAIGLVAAFLAPFLVEARAPNPPAFHLYAAIVTAAAVTLAWVRGWLWFALAAIGVGASLGVVVMIGSGVGAGWGAAQALLGLVTVAALMVPGVWGAPARERGADLPAAAAMIAFLTLGALAVLDARHDMVVLVVFAGLAAATLALAIRSPAIDLAVAAAGLLAVLILAGWAVGIAPAAVLDPLAAPADFPENLTRLIIAAALLGAILGAGPLAAILARRYTEARPVLVFAATGAAMSVTIVAVLYGKIEGFAPSLRFAALALLISVLHGAATEALWRRRRGGSPGLASASAILAIAALGALALALSIALEKAALTFALAALPAAIAWVYLHRPLPALRWAAAIAGVVALLRVFGEPSILRDPGETLLFNWLLPAFGLPAASCFLAAIFLRRRRGEDEPVQVLEAIGLMALALLAVTEVRHAFGAPIMPRLGLAPVRLSFGEAAAHTLTILAFTLGLARLTLARTSKVFAAATTVARWGAVAWIAVVMGFLVNPWITGGSVGPQVVLNWALVGYLGGAVLAALVAWFDRAGGRLLEARAMSVAAIGLSFVWLGTQIATLFRGVRFQALPMGDAELYAHSAAWLAVGVGVLVLGGALGSRFLRLVSAALVGLAVLKVFLFDMAGLTGLWRALSFIGLGLALMAIGRLYQRVLFAGRASAQT